MVQERRVERRLSAILAADVAGYSRLMHHDEEAAHAKLTALLTGAVLPRAQRCADVAGEQSKSANQRETTTGPLSSAFCNAGNCVVRRL
jgi:hypothetical protein